MEQAFLAGLVFSSSNLETADSDLLDDIANDLSSAGNQLEANLAVYNHYKEALATPILPAKPTLGEG